MAKLIRTLLASTALITAFHLNAAPGATSGEVVLEEESHQANFKLVVVADNLSYPWGIDFLPDGAPIVTEWTGGVRVIRDGKVSAPLKGVPPVLSRNERTFGMFSVSVHPDFNKNQLIYLCHQHGTWESNVTRIVRARLVGDRLEDMSTVFEGNDRAHEFHHAGCRLNWSDGGHLFATFGDRRHLPDDSQDLQSTTGTIIRINEDGTAPADNPFTGQEGARAEIWAYGVRNVQGATLHPQTGELWFSEHGPLGGDEVNILKKGANYGWPIATYGIDYDGSVITENATLPGVEGPLIYWRPSTAPSGLAFYTGDDFPAWKGDLFMGSLMDRRLIRMEIDGERVLFQEPLLGQLDTRIREVRMGPDGYLYVLTDEDPGVVLRIEPK